MVRDQSDLLWRRDRRAASKRRVTLAFHFGSLLDDRSGVFEASDAKFVRGIGFESADDVDDAVIRDLLTRAVDAATQLG